MAEPAKLIRLTVRVTPNAARDDVKSARAELVEIRLRAPAVEGKANAALIRFLAARLGLRSRQVALLRGEASRTKLVEIVGLDVAEALAKLRT